MDGEIFESSAAVAFAIDWKDAAIMANKNNIATILPKYFFFFIAVSPDYFSAEYTNNFSVSF